MQGGTLSGKRHRSKWNIRYLGFEVDSLNSCYRLPQDKLEYILRVKDRELDSGSQQSGTPARAAAKILGRLAACRLSHGRMLHFKTRHLQHQVGTAAEAGGWDCTIVWQVEALEELKWLQENLKQYNGKAY